MKILIAGGCGFIGSNLSIFLSKKNFKVLSVDNLSKNYCLLNEHRLKKHKIRKRTECTGLRDNITMKAEAIIINENK